jgi:hypothetical protein
VKRLIVPLVFVAALVVGAIPASAGNDLKGNGAPSGPHYNLNLIGFSNGQNVKNTTGAGGNVIHVPLDGHCQIDLTEGDFQVLDDNCTDNSDALFQLPDPCPGTDNCDTSAYSVFAAAKGKPLGSATSQTCFTDTTTSTLYCSSIVMELNRNYGSNKFMNATKYLLYVYACVNGSIKRTALFDSNTQDWYWSYNNDGLRVAQLRFYPGYQTTVPPAGADCSV